MGDRKIKEILASQCEHLKNTNKKEAFCFLLRLLCYMVIIIPELRGM
jgi:penicillin-binding protein-related factor A (putative recombinase)